MNCMACGTRLGPEDYPRRKALIFGILIDKPVVCWDLKACLHRVEKIHPTLVPDMGMLDHQRNER